jgi:hypothetical protein
VCGKKQGRAGNQRKTANTGLESRDHQVAPVLTCIRTWVASEMGRRSRRWKVTIITPMSCGPAASKQHTFDPADQPCDLTFLVGVGNKQGARHMANVSEEIRPLFNIVG